jgi:ureidoacrylate peracid hydrolase
MHKVEIAPRIIARILERRDTLHPFERIDCHRTAHVVVDLQNGFMAPGQPVENPIAIEIVPAVNRISAALRAAGGLVVYIQNTFTPESLQSWSTHFFDMQKAERRERTMQAFTPGDFGHELWAGLEVLPQDLKVQKTRFGAFVQGASELHAILQARGIDTLIITGTATNVCCESTARDAMMLNYKVLFVSDANAARTDEDHNATLNALAVGFADVLSTEEVIAVIGRSTALRQAAE